MSKVIMSLAALTLSTAAFSAHIPDGINPPETLTAYEQCRLLELKGIVPLVPCDTFVSHEGSSSGPDMSSDKEKCLALEDKGIEPLIPCDEL